MSYDTLRVYQAGQFQDVPLPDWFCEALRISEQERVDWHRALERVLDCELMMLTGEATMGCLIEVRAWPSSLHGFLVLFETPEFLVEQVLIPKATDWLPFMAQHITPIISAAAQGASAEDQTRLANAFIAWARHGEGCHVGRETGRSRIDLDRDRARRRAELARETVAQPRKWSEA